MATSFSNQKGETELQKRERTQDKADYKEEENIEKKDRQKED